MSPEEHFQPFFQNINTSESNSDFDPTVFGRFVKTAFYVPRGTFCYKNYFLEKITSRIFSDIERTIFRF